MRDLWQGQQRHDHHQRALAEAATCEVEGSEETDVFFPDGHVPEPFFEVGQQKDDAQEKKDPVLAENHFEQAPCEAVVAGGGTIATRGETIAVGAQPVLFLTVEPDQGHIRNAVTDDIEQGEGHIAVEPYNTKVPGKHGSGKDGHAGQIEVTVMEQRYYFTDNPGQKSDPIEKSSQLQDPVAAKENKIIVDKPVEMAGFAEVPVDQRV